MRRSHSYRESGLLRPSRKLIRPSRRAFIVGAAAFLAAPAIVRAGSLPLLGAGGPSGAAWTPASLTGLIGWYKADAQVYNSGTTLATNGQTISQWTDQSGLNNHLVNVIGYGVPTWASAGLNGKPAVQFVQASAQGLGTTADSVAMGTGNQVSCFILGSLTTSANAQGVGYAGNGVAITSIPFDLHSAVIMQLTSTPGFEWFYNSGNGTADSVSANTETQMGMVFDGVNGTPYVNNVAGTSNALNFNWTSPGRLIVGSQGTTGWDGFIRELFITNGAVSSSDRSNIATYLTSRT